MMHDWSKTRLFVLLIRSILPGKNYPRAEALVIFSRVKSNELTEQQDMFPTIPVDGKKMILIELS